jgi:hypothetical protein
MIQNSAGRGVDEHCGVMPTHFGEHLIQTRVTEIHAIRVRHHGEPHSTKGLQSILDLVDRLVDAWQWQRSGKPELSRMRSANTRELLVGLAGHANRLLIVARCEMRTWGSNVQDRYCYLVIPRQLDVILRTTLLYRY